MAKANIGIWDGELAIPIPDHIAASVGLIEGDEVDLTVADDGAIILSSLGPQRPETLP